MQHRNPTLYNRQGGGHIRHQLKQGNPQNKRPRCEIQQIESRVKRLVRRAHREQNRFVGVVQAHYGIPRHVYELVGLFTLQDRAVQVDPVARDVHGDRHLEQEHVLGVEVRECHQEAHGAATIGQLVEHRPEFRALVEVTGGVAVERVQQGACYVAPDRDYVVGCHEVEGD